MMRIIAVLTCFVALSGCNMERFAEAQRDPVGAFHRSGLAAAVRQSRPTVYTDCRQSCYAGTCYTVCETW
jgi:hypothetical protein